MRLKIIAIAASVIGIISLLTLTGRFLMPCEKVLVEKNETVFINITKPIVKVEEVCEEISIPIEKESTWRVRWYEVDENLSFTDELGESEFPCSFERYWEGTVYGNLTRVGFRAKMEIEGKGKVQLILCSDDGARLYMDGKMILDLWGIHGTMCKSTELELDGRHELKLEWFNWEKSGMISFRIDSNACRLKETMIKRFCYNQTKVELVNQSIPITVKSYKMVCK